MYWLSKQPIIVPDEPKDLTVDCGSVVRVFFVIDEDKDLELARGDTHAGQPLFSRSTIEIILRAWFHLYLSDGVSDPVLRRGTDIDHAAGETWHGLGRLGAEGLRTCTIHPQRRLGGNGVRTSIELASIIASDAGPHPRRSDPMRNHVGRLVNHAL